MYPFLVILLVFSRSNFEASSFSAGSRSLLRSLVDDASVGYFPDVAVELNETNFNDVLRETPASFAIVEFFAHWCPACRNYKVSSVHREICWFPLPREEKSRNGKKPHYEKVARVFNGPKAAHPGIILMTRVDCALKTNSKLCDRFSVDRYPMLLWGRPRKFASVNSWDGKDGEIESINDGRTAERLLDWINKKLKSVTGGHFNIASFFWGLGIVARRKGGQISLSWWEFVKLLQVGDSLSPYLPNSLHPLDLQTGILVPERYSPGIRNTVGRDPICHSYGSRVSKVSDGFFNGRIVVQSGHQLMGFSPYFQ
ncbi:hypothetical protein Cgig2_031702 [Carnegiea gigantea]|uniref:Thioredoxin domain-containing protein n=1 Tax=Carnegiea gigantea TaxID=171969 RepID=A0A9Q1KRN9_9CARY|nr:hypothetical protein Cgig2_031702 [Carnegiea gigantea]